MAEAHSEDRELLSTFLALYFHDPAVGLLRAAEARLLRARPLAPPILDLGCGDGSFAARSLTTPIEVGVDRSLPRARRARASGAYRAVVVADAHRLPFRERTFASVLSNSTLEHIPGVGDVLREVERTLRPGGTLLFTVHNDRFATRMYFWPRLFALLGQPGWTERYRRCRLRRLAMANLMRADEWEALLAEAGLEAGESEGYLAGRLERRFEVLLVLARFGIGRVNIGAALRIADRALAAAGIELHRRLAGRLLARLLAGDETDSEGAPAALLLRASLSPAEAARASAHAPTPVVRIESYRRG